MDKVKIKAVLFAVVVIVSFAMTVGCSAPGSTSGFKPEQVPSKDQLNQQIADVKANPRIPAGIKAMAIAHLKKELTDSN